MEDVKRNSGPAETPRREPTEERPTNELDADEGLGGAAGVDRELDEEKGRRGNRRARGARRRG